MKVYFDSKTFDSYIKANKKLVLSTKKCLPRKRRYLIDLGIISAGIHGTDNLIRKQFIIGKVDSESRYGLYSDRSKEYDKLAIEKELLIKKLIPSRLMIRSAIIDQAYVEIMDIANRGVQANPDEISTVSFLENCVEIYFPYLLNDLIGYSKISKLKMFRVKSGRRFNTVCQRCGAPLKRTNTKTKLMPVVNDNIWYVYTPSHCYRSENRSCSESRNKRQSPKLKPPYVAVGNCVFCHVITTSVITKKIHGAVYNFCSQSHYQSMRRALVRRKQRE
ncbi:MAG: hypothetical protein WC734_03815 [Patescibacteria group bacterium]|jgi:hypothetical protein